MDNSLFGPYRRSAPFDLSSNLTFEQLRTMHTIIDSGSFTAAAERLHMSQSAVSQRVSQLERMLGTRLFVRKGRSAVRLTEAGTIVHRFAEETARGVTDLQQHLLCNDSTPPSALRIAAGPATARYLLPDVLASYNLANPAVQVGIKEGLLETVVGLLHEDQAELGVWAGPTLPGALNGEVLLRSSLVGVAWAGYHEDRERPPLAGAPFALLPGGTELRSTVDQWAHSENLKLKVVAESNNVDTIKELVRRKVAIAVLPKFAVDQDFANGSLERFSLPRFREDYLLSMVWLPGRLTPPASAFLASVRDLSAAWRPRERPRVSSPWYY